jgi:hypothetical protein
MALVFGSALMPALGALACSSAGSASPVVESDLPPPASASAPMSGRAPLARPTVIDLSVTDKAGRNLLVQLEVKAFAGCLATAEPGESGYALFTEPLDPNDPDSRRVLDEEGLSPATLGCIRGVLARSRETSILVNDTFWYVSVQP